jgi:hypothetical protein
MWYKSFQNATWNSKFTTIGGPLNSNPWANIGVSRRINGILDIYTVGTDRSCVHKHWTGNLTADVFTPSGTDYINFAGAFSSSIETMSTFTTRVDLFALTEAKRLTQLTWMNGQTTTWTEVVGQNASTAWLFTPAIVVATRKRGDVFVVDAKTLQVSQLAWTGSGANPILSQNIGGSCTSRPSATSWSDGRIDIFCRDANAVLSWSSLPSLTSNWIEWKPVIGSPIISNEPHAISRTSGTLQVFVQTANDSVAFANFDGQEWKWMDLGGTFAGPPRALSDDALRIDVFVNDKSGALKHKSWNGSNKMDGISFLPLNAWEDLGTP